MPIAFYANAEFTLFDVIDVFNFCFPFAGSILISIFACLFHHSGTIRQWRLSSK
jgi:hypothetical protein